jgi:hypothetical protein
MHGCSLVHVMLDVAGIAGIAGTCGRVNGATVMTDKIESSDKQLVPPVGRPSHDATIAQMRAQSPPPPPFSPFPAGPLITQCA